VLWYQKLCRNSNIRVPCTQRAPKCPNKVYGFDFKYLNYSPAQNFHLIFDDRKTWRICLFSKYFCLLMPGKLWGPSLTLSSPTGEDALRQRPAYGCQTQRTLSSLQSLRGETFKDKVSVVFYCSSEVLMPLLMFFLFSSNRDTKALSWKSPAKMAKQLRWVTGKDEVPNMPNLHVLWFSPHFVSILIWIPIVISPFQPVGFVTFSTRAGAEAAKQDLQVNKKVHQLKSKD